MKFTKTEKIWLVAVVLFFVLYNLPFVPKYNHSVATIVHALITLIPLWIAVYVGLVKVCRIYRLREDAEKTVPKQNTDADTSSVSQTDVFPTDTISANTDCEEQTEGGNHTC